MSTAASHKAPPNRGLVESLLLSSGLVDHEKISYARRVQSKLVSQKPLLVVLQELDLLSDADLQQLLKNNPSLLNIGTLLVELGHLKESDRDSALQIQRETGSKQKLGEILREYGFIDEDRLMESLASQLALPIVIPELEALDHSLMRKVPPKAYSDHSFIPNRRLENGVEIIFADPLDLRAREAAERIFGLNIIPAIGPRQTIREAIEVFKRGSSRGQLPEPDENTVRGILDGLLDDALREKVSDIHIEPMRDRLRIRFRKDGLLVTHREYGTELASSLATRLKVLSRADIAERRRHQDGRILHQSSTTGITLDLRVSFYITVFGEKIVLRLLNKKGELLDMEELGMAPKMLRQLREESLDHPSGIMVVTGPTGAGKTTSLYSAVNYLNNPETSIITAEEPVEYLIDGIAQCSINQRIGVTFTETLRHIVRQDPDIIVLGEIRDTFSAETAIHAALTGHKVLTTLHAEESVGALLRLMNMDIEPFLIASTLNSIVAQRLLRRTCLDCAEGYTPTPDEIRRLGYTQEELRGGDFMQGRGCQNCGFTGYSGRVGIFELLILNEQVKESVQEGRTAYDLRRTSMEASGLVTLFEDGLYKAARGLVSLQEVLRRLPRPQKPRPLREIRRLLGE